MLPAVPLPTAMVDVAGTKVEVRGLSRAEAVALQAFEGDYDAAEVFVLSRGAGVEEEVAAEWRRTSPPDACAALIDKIVELSALDGSAGKG